MVLARLLMCAGLSVLAMQPALARSSKPLSAMVLYTTHSTILVPTDSASSPLRVPGLVVQDGQGHVDGVVLQGQRRGSSYHQTGCPQTSLSAVSLVGGVAYLVGQSQSCDEGALQPLTLTLPLVQHPARPTFGERVSTLCQPLGASQRQPLQPQDQHTEGACKLHELAKLTPMSLAKLSPTEQQSLGERLQACACTETEFSQVVFTTGFGRLIRTSETTDKLHLQGPRITSVGPLDTRWCQPEDPCGPLAPFRSKTFEPIWSTTDGTYALAWDKQGQVVLLQSGKTKPIQVIKMDGKAIGARWHRDATPLAQHLQGIANKEVKVSEATLDLGYYPSLPSDSEAPRPYARSYAAPSLPVSGWSQRRAQLLDALNLSEATPTPSAPPRTQPEFPKPSPVPQPETPSASKPDSAPPSEARPLPLRCPEAPPRRFAQKDSMQRRSAQADHEACQASYKAKRYNEAWALCTKAYQGHDQAHVLGAITATLSLIAQAQEKPVQAYALLGYSVVLREHTPSRAKLKATPASVTKVLGPLDESIFRVLHQSLSKSKPLLPEVCH